MTTPIYPLVGLVGAGAMGRGIAQIAAQGGCQVLLFDAQSGAADTARAAVQEQWQRLLSKGRISEEQLQAWSARLQPVADMAALKDCTLVVEAIVERLDIKQAVFAQLEAVVAPDAVLVSNTSSLSVTQIAAGLQRPARFAGLHFFNPVPLMKVVEVIAGLKTDPALCDALARAVRQWGHQPVQAQDTPGFIVNHAGRGYNTEALRIVGEGIADFATIDRILRDQAGFRLGPFELMDLTALDVSHPVMEAIYRQYYDEPRYRPSVITAQRLAGGVVGKKAGQGFYRYDNGRAQVPPEPPVPDVAVLPPVWVSPQATRRAALCALLHTLGAELETQATPSAQALIVVAPLGLDVSAAAVAESLDATRTVGIDLLIDDCATQRRVLATNPATRADMRAAAHALFARDGKAVSVVRDSGGFVTQRVLATIVNIAADICQQRICTPQDLETAVTLGLGYPQGPLALGECWGAERVLQVLDNLQTVYGDPRYRPSPWLRRRALLGLSLMHAED
ncbi:3-hydroxyacyl-CoA dehydrogenase [Comamonas denitrificans]|uniref:3-hydroxyacyl-CoA dehydrogenase n=1 Tax=Comamonas denitrificans TaxID=117506 RepID=A0A939KDL6_9BURK|nr:3-hydroxyacyl-CoA dehydrogenase [Comamonas denitrificans]MBO1248538.1 3-hydroxyacyl-CoA dehydrogenase [Comamonas denitrificans]